MDYPVIVMTVIQVPFNVGRLYIPPILAPFTERWVSKLKAGSGGNSEPAIIMKNS